MATSGGAAPVEAKQPGSQDPLVLSYLSLRKAVGIIGFSLPFVLVFGNYLASLIERLRTPGLESSISCYYYTDMGNVFVGSLCAIGIFLMSCRGYDQKDAVAGSFACAFAIGVALFPTSPCPGSTAQAEVISKIHWSCAALLFGTLAYFCLALFTKTSGNPTPRKLKRNIVYRACGVIIIISILLIGAIKLLPTTSSLEPLAPVFWLESTAVVAFGFAWLTKGEAILKDK